MSTCTITNSTVHFVPHLTYFVKKKYLHRAPDHTYTSIWKKAKIDFMQQSASEWRNPDRNPSKNFYNSPHLVEQILRTTVSLKEKRLVPFLHAMPAGSRIGRKLMHLMYPHNGNPFFSYLRPPTERYKQSHEKAWQRIPKEETPTPKEHLVSMSYALTSGIGPLETAASWGFVNHFGNEQFFTLNDQCRALLKKCVLEPQERKYFEASILNLTIRYNRLKIGRFMAIGIPPEKVERFAYDSKPYNVPTGHSVLEIAKNPERYMNSLMEHKTHFATLVISEELLDSSCGMVVIDATHSKEVEAFCQDMPFTPLKEIENYKALTAETTTEFETQQREQREQLDTELDQLIDQLQHKEKYSELFAHIPPCCGIAGDYPEQMI